MRCARPIFPIDFRLADGLGVGHPARVGLRLWWNWQTRYFEVVVPQGVQVQVLLTAPLLLGKTTNSGVPAQIPHNFRLIPGAR